MGFTPRHGRAGCSRSRVKEGRMARAGPQDLIMTAWTAAHR